MVQLLTAQPVLIIPLIVLHVNQDIIGLTQRHVQVVYLFQAVVHHVTIQEQDVVLVRRQAIIKNQVHAMHVLL